MKARTISTQNWLTRGIQGFWETVKTKAFWSDAVIFICGLLFLYSAGDKLWEYEKFEIQVGKSPILTGYEAIIAWFIPSVEILIALFMIPLWTRQIGLYAFFTLMLLFTGYIILLLQDGTIIPCGCNALTEKLSLQAHIVMNLGFCALTIAGVFISPRWNLRFSRAHPLYREFIVPVKSRIRSIFHSLKGRRVTGTNP